ncbi:MAG TPA: hypothetical protein VKU39_01550 [Streptosporangiaceae bacterium]|nr:hypothetical protein [Streptosporangiaceae bacterium]
MVRTVFVSGTTASKMTGWLWRLARFGIPDLQQARISADIERARR